MARLKLLLFSLIILFSSAVNAQDVEFQALVTKKKIGQFERFRVDFTINRNAGDITPPDFADFAFLGGPSTSVSSRYVNGKGSTSKTFSYYLMPKSVGEFEIGEAKIEYDGMVYRSNKIKITVVEGEAKSNDPNDPSSFASRNVKLKMEVSNSNPYVNEQITVSYYLYFKTNISRPQIVEQPKFSGFWNQEFELQNNRQEQDYLDEELYQKILLRKTLLIPQKSGQLEIAPMVMIVPVEISTGRLDFFGQPLTRSYEYSVSVPKKTINVKELPLAGRPENFSGAVGQFSFSVNPSKTTVEANESITLKVSVRGKGNMKLFNIPKLELPDELEAYDPKYTEKVQLTPRGLNGSISDEYIIIPRYKGKYKVEGLDFTYFDPSKEKYMRLNGGDFTIDVIKGESAIAGGSLSGKIRAKNDVELIGSDIRFIHSKADFSSYDEDEFFGSYAYYFLLILPFLFIPMFYFISYRRKKELGDEVSYKRKRALKTAKKMMSEAETALKSNDDTKFYEVLINTIYKYLSNSLNIAQGDLNKDNIKNKLKEKGKDDSSIDNLMDIISECEISRYAPVSGSRSKEQLYNSTLELISSLEK